VTKILEFGLATIGVLIAFPFVNGQKSNGGGVLGMDFLIYYLFIPPFIVSPLIALIAHRVRQSWKINHYIRKKYEEEHNIHWETFSKKRDDERGISPRYIYAATFAFITIQVIMPATSIVLLVSQSQNFLVTVLCGMLTTIIIGLLHYELRLLKEADNPKFKYP
jgi:hypothetical protein